MRNQSTTSSIDSSQHKKSTSSIDRSYATGGDTQKSKFLGIFQQTIKHFPTIGAKDSKVDFNCHKAHIKNTLLQFFLRKMLGTRYGPVGTRFL